MSQSTTLAQPEPIASPPASQDGDATRRLREQYTEIAQLAGGLAHEIRNPLSTMRMNLDLLAEEFQDPSSPRDRRVLQKLERIRKESRRLEGLLEDFLRLARAQELRLETVQLNTLVDDLCDFFEPQAIAQGIVIRRHLAEDLPLVRLDRDRFQQAVFNLIRNAELAMPDGGELIVTTRRENGYVALDLTDTGCGIPADVLPHIFEPFYSSRPGGTGLGLPTVRRIVEAHQGRMSVESEPGKGSRFTILIPCSPNDS